MLVVKNANCSSINLDWLLAFMRLRPEEALHCFLIRITIKCNIHKECYLHNIEDLLRM